MLGSHRRSGPTKSTRTKKDADGVVEPDPRLVFAVLAAGVIVGALVTPPARSSPLAPLASAGAKQTDGR